MTQAQAIELIKKVSIDTTEPQHWADLGCGKGMFSIALASLLPPQSHILCIDKTNYHFPPFTQNEVRLEFKQLDFIQEPVSNEKLDGIVMANSLHFVENKEKLIPKLASYLKDTGSFLLIEYDTDQSSWWNPYPLPYPEVRKLFKISGFTEIRQIGYRSAGWGPKNMYVCEIKRS